LHLQLQPRTLRRSDVLGVGPVPHGALHQVHVGGERGATRAVDLRHRLRQARGAVGRRDAAEEALRDAPHGARGAHLVPAARRGRGGGVHALLQLRQDGVAGPEEPGVPARAGAAPVVRHGGVVGAADEVAPGGAVPHVAPVRLQRRRGRAGAHRRAEPQHRVAHARLALARAQVAAALVQAVGGRRSAVDRGGLGLRAGAGGEAAVGGAGGRGGGHGCQEGVEVALEGRVGRVPRRRAPCVDERARRGVDVEEEYGREAADDDEVHS